MAAGSIVGAFLGGLLLNVVPTAALRRHSWPASVLSAVKVWSHG